MRKIIKIERGDSIKMLYDPPPRLRDLNKFVSMIPPRIAPSSNDTIEYSNFRKRYPIRPANNTVKTSINEILSEYEPEIANTTTRGMI